MTSLFSLYETMLIDSNYMDWLKNLQIGFVPEMNPNVLDISNFRSVSNNKKVKKVFIKIICGKFEYWENNYKNYLARLK